VLLAPGRDDEAAGFAAAAEALAERDDVAAQAFQRLARSRVVLRDGEVAEAERLAEEAVALAEPTDFLALQAECATALARVLQAAGRPSDAGALLTRARDLYETKGNLVARRLTGDLARPGATA